MLTLSPLTITFTILLLTTLMFLWGRWRADLVAALSLMALVLSGVLDTGEALSGFSSSLVLMIAGLFVVGAGVFRTGLAEVAGRAVVARAGSNPTTLLAALMALVALLSGFMSNTGTVAVLMPVIVSVALRLRISPAKFLMPVAFMSGLGGLLTLIGTPPNLIASGALRDAGTGGLGFFTLLPIGALAVLAGGAFMLLLGPRLLRGGASAENAESSRTPAELLRAYDLPAHITALHVPAASQAAGRTLAELHWPRDYRVQALVLERPHGLSAPLPTALGHAREERTERLQVMRRPERRTAHSSSELHVGDTVYVLGSAEDVTRLQADMGLAAQTVRPESSAANHLTDKHIGVAEVLIPAESRFIGKTLGELNWPAAWGLNVLALRRGGRLVEISAQQRLHFADTLLVQGAWERIEALARESRHAVVVGKVADHASNARARGKAPIAAALMLGMMLLMTFEVLPPVVAVWLAALGMVLTGCLRNMAEAYRRISWESVVLIAAMLPMATALEKTGGVALVADAFVAGLGPLGPLAVMASFYVATMLLSQFISNTATAVLFAPIAISTAAALGVQPQPMVVAVAVAASMAFATPIASPPNALVMTAGGYTFADYARLGLPLQLFLFALMLLAIPAVFPF